MEEQKVNAWEDKKKTSSPNGDQPRSLKQRWLEGGG